MSFEEYSKKELALDFLAEHLYKGTLVLFLGAGTSAGMGLPEWGDFVNRLRSSVGLGTIDPNSDSSKLQVAVDDVKEKCKSTDIYYSLIKETLYKDVTFNSSLLKNDLLIALSALLMGSRRGNVRKVVTLNFDSTLEWVLKTYGFTSRVVSKLPALEGAEDVCIFHPHGFLPHPSLTSLVDSEKIILSFDEINLRLGDITDPWTQVMRHLSRSSLFLFVGLSERSFRDPIVTSLLAATAADLKGSRPVGFWILNKEPSDRKIFFRNTVIPLVMDSNVGIANFLLEVCQKVAPDFEV